AYHTRLPPVAPPSSPYTTPFRSVSLPSTPAQGARTASRELVAHIIHQRVDEIFQLVGREFERAGYGAGRLPAGVVLSGGTAHLRSEEHTSELQSLTNLVCRLLLE